eukprot:TRINITY_DN94049_c0_g1_i1.p1 TRINITY_DN94049_c0_g1~~TRINITY_DN94049_c0_g1_i1.p1  ORF type:complete len:483 (-),score=73.94 TRINITY_DN94049_c0_g1_i1:289-1737(-)
MAMPNQDTLVAGKDGAAKQQLWSVTSLPREPLSHEAKDEAHKALSRFFVLGVAAQNVILFSDTQLIMQCVKGDAARTASVIAATSSAAGLVEFFVNPALGKLADQLGRKFVFYIGPVVSGMTMSALVLLTKGQSLPVLIAHRTVNWSFNAMSGSFIAPIVCSDMFSGPELGVRIAKVLGAIGISASLAPGAGSLLMRRGSTLTPYKVRFLLAATQVAFATKFIPETLEKCKQRAFQLRDVNPTKFLQLFAKPGVLRTLSVMLFLHTFTEGKVVVSFCQGWMNGPPLRWPLRLQSLHSLVFGALMYTAGTYLMPWLVEQRGPRGYTSLANAFSAAGLLLSGLPKPFGYAVDFWLGLLLHMPGVNGTSAAVCKGLAAEHAVAAGFGRGEYGGMYSSARNLSIFLAPLVYGAAYRRATTHTSKPSALKLWTPWLCMAFLGAVLPELLHRTMSDDELLHVKRASSKSIIDHKKTNGQDTAPANKQS